MTAASLSVVDVTKKYGGVTALQSVSFDVADGKIHGIIGPNGAGKSSVIDIISGFALPTSGRVLIDGRSVKPKPFSIARAGVARTFQHTSLFTGETVRSNLEIARASMARGLRGRWRGVDEKGLDDLLETVGLVSFAAAPAESLPYGAQRRLAVAIAMVSDPDLLLLDEPAAGMNPVESEEFVSLVRRLAEGRTVVLVEHDMTVIRALCEHTTVLVDGHVLTAGPTAEVLDDERVIDVYLGVSE